MISLHGARVRCARINPIEPPLCASLVGVIQYDYESSKRSQNKIIILYLCVCLVFGVFLVCAARTQQRTVGSCHPEMAALQKIRSVTY